jgi:hypothetical protein
MTIVETHSVTGRAVDGHSNAAPAGAAHPILFAPRSRENESRSELDRREQAVESERNRRYAKRIVDAEERGQAELPELVTRAR